MLPTVDDVLRMEVLQRGEPRIVAGATNTTNPVRWAHVSELADVARLLQGGELVLTTGVVLPDDGASLERYVGELLSVGAAGLVVELGRRYRRTLPAGLVAAAESCGLPLIELHRETSFVLVTEAIYSLIVDTQLAELRASEEIHEIFTELSTEGADPARVVQEVARLARRPAVLENLAHQVLVYDAAGRAPYDLLRRWEDRSRQVSLPGMARTTYDEASGWLATTVGARGRDWGRLVVLLDPSSGAGPRVQTLVERAASALALNRLIVREEEGLERQSHRTLLSGILSNAYPAAEVVLRSQALGVPLEHRCLIGLVIRVRPDTVNGSGHELPLIKLHERMRVFSEIAALAVKEGRLTALVGSLDEQHVGLMLSLAASDDERVALDVLTSRLRRAIAERESIAASTFVIGVGSCVQAVPEARHSLLEAMQVAEAVLHQAPHERPYFRMRDVRLRGLLYLLRDDARLQAYVEHELGPLLAYDALHGTQLAETLRVYLEHGANKSAAADVAHLSRPALYDRLARIERILGVDLNSVESCLSLHIALLTFDVVRP